MAINQYGMPEGYDQEANPNPRQRRRAVPRPQPEATPFTPQEQQQAPQQQAPPVQEGWINRPDMPNGGIVDPETPPPIVRNFPTPPPQTPAPAPVPKRYNVSLMEGDPEKLASQAHALKSPKYQFLQLAQSGQFNYDQLPQMLAQLQQTNPDFWKDWVADGDKFRYTGDPNKLHGAWEGVTEVDAVGNFTSTDGSAPTGFRWGARNIAAEQAQAQQQAMQQALSQSQSTYAPGRPPQIPRPATQAVQPGGGGISFLGGSNDFDERTGTYRSTGTEFPPGMMNNPLPEVPFQQFAGLRRNPEAHINYGIGQDNDLRTYEPINDIPEFSRPDFGKYEDAQLNALLGVLQNPGIPEQQLNQMRQIQQEQLMAQRDEALEATRTNSLRRGLRGGALGAAERRLGNQFAADLTRSNRDIDIANAGMRTQDIFGAAGQLGGAMTGINSRNIDNFSTALNRVLAGEQLRGASADSYRAVYNDDMGNNFNNLNLAEQIRQFDLSNQLALKNFFEGQRQFNSNMGYNYTSLQNNNNLALLRALGFNV